MPVFDFLVRTPVVRSARVLQLEGLFDLPFEEASERRWSIALPLEEKDWAIGLIVGPSGSGKSTLLRQAFGDSVPNLNWPADASIVDAFPAHLGIKDVTALLSSVGFSSPPSWLRPFRCLSNGEQFRVTLARLLAEPSDLTCIDEFTSVVDRTVAQIGSAAVAKAIRRLPGKRLIAATCHDDVEAWLCPDWVLRLPDGDFVWRLLRRPPIELCITRVSAAAWRLFAHHHYLSAKCSAAAKCFLASWRGVPVAFTAVMPLVSSVPGWREHRTVCLPDFQGVGIGNALSEYVASLFAAPKRGYYSTTSNPAMIRHRYRSPLWKVTRKPSLIRAQGMKDWLSARSSNRLTASFRYTGPVRPEDASRFGLVKP